MQDEKVKDWVIIFNMGKSPFSEDYEKILNYKNSVSSEDFERIQEETASFFSNKYSDLIKRQYKILYDLLTRHSNFEGIMDFEEAGNFSLAVPEEERFENLVTEKYIPQALNSFNPEKIINKHNYCFATYMYNYLRHAVRDSASKWQKMMNKSTREIHQTSPEEEILLEAEIRTIKEKFADLQKQLNPLELQILDSIIHGKKQKDVILINKKSGMPYSKGYISKLVKKIRNKMKKLMESK